MDEILASLLFNLLRPSTPVEFCPVQPPPVFLSPPLVILLPFEPTFRHPPSLITLSALLEGLLYRITPEEWKADMEKRTPRS